METAEGNITANAGAIQDLDSSAVHKSGAETIAGAKSFTGAVDASGGLTVRDASAPAIGLYKGDAEAGSVGASGTQIGISAGGAFLGLKDTAGTPYATAPTAGSGVSDSSAIITKGGLASDTTVVHTTGTETIGGAKTFTAKVTETLNQPIIDLISSRAPGTNFVRARFQIHDNGSADPQPVVEHKYNSQTLYNAFETDVYAPDRQSSGSFWVRRYSDHTEVRVVPYYPVDADENPVPLAEQMLVTSGNIAIDPRIVHTTGTETIAGSKSFSSAVNSDGGFRWYYAMPALTTSNWIKLYTFEPPAGTTALRVLIEAIDSGGMLATMFDVIEVVVHTSMTLGGSIRSNSNVIAKLALNAAGKIELWLHKTTGSGTTYLYCNFLAMRGLRGVTVDNASGTEPEEGADYSSVITLEAVE